MTDVDTSADAVERLAEWLDKERHPYGSDLLRALAEQRDAGREFMRSAWHQFNAIRAHRGAPEGISHAWWNQITDAMDEMLGDDALPWMTKAAKLLVAPYEVRENEAATARYEAEASRDAALAQIDAARMAGWHVGYEAGLAEAGADAHAYQWGQPTPPRAQPPSSWPDPVREAVARERALRGAAAIVADWPTWWSETDPDQVAEAILALIDQPAAAPTRSHQHGRG